MANTKISQLPAAISLTAAADVAPIVHSGTTYKATPNQIVNVVLPSPGPIGSTTPNTGAFTALTVTGSTALSSTLTGLVKATAGLIGTATPGSDYLVPNGALGTPSSGTLTNCTGLPVSSGISGLGAGIASFLASPSSANLATAVTDETGSGSLVFATSPTLVTPNLGIPASGTLSNCTGLPLTTGVTGTLPVTSGGTGANTLTGLVKGNGTSAFTAAVSGTDYAPATSGTSILYGNGAGGFSNVVIGSNMSFSGGVLATTAGGGSVTSASVVTANGFAGTVATPTSTPAITLSTTVTGVLKGNGTAISAAVSGTDYAPATSGSSILYGDGAGGFSNVTIGSGLSFSTGTLTATGGGSGTVTSVSGTGTVSGISLSGTVTTSGSLTLGGTLDLSTPPAIGGTTPAAITGTTITANTKFVSSYFDASGSGGGALRTSAGTACLQWGGGGGTNLTLDGAFNMNPANATISIAPTGTGTLTVNPATAGTINNVAIGGSTAAAGTFTALTATGTTTLATSLTGLLKATSGVVSSAVAGTDYVAVNGALGTPSSGTLTNCTGLPISTGVSGLGTNVATFLATPSSANLASAVTDETGSGLLVFGTNPTITNYTETSYSANSSTAITLSLANGTMQYITLTGSPTITMPAVAAGKSFTLVLYTGSGSYTVSWSTVAWAGGTTPTVTTTASKKDIFNFYSDGTSWYGAIFGQSF